MGAAVVVGAAAEVVAGVVVGAIVTGVVVLGVAPPIGRPPAPSVTV